MFGRHVVNRRWQWVVALVLAALLVSGVAVTAQGPRPQASLGTGFTYQGQLKKNNGPVNDTCNLTFSLWDAQGSGSPPTGGTQVGGNQLKPSVSVVNGLFTALLNEAGQFGPNAFNGQERWLQVAVQCPGDGAPVALSRQPVTAAPYALYASGNWGLNGNAGTNANNFVGTTDNMSLTLGVSGTAALRLIPSPESPIVIGGYSGNRVGGIANGVTIGGGGTLSHTNVISGSAVSYSTIAGGRDNRITGFLSVGSTVGGGYSNSIRAGWAVIAGGYSNAAIGSTSTVGGGINNVASGGASTVSGGQGNTASGGYSAVSGGQGNTASGGYSTVSGGDYNTASSNFSTVSGGDGNTASNDYSTVGGGGSNTASNGYSVVSGGGGNMASGRYSAVSGGSGNTASGDHSTVSGGASNTATSTYSTVSGGYSNQASGYTSFAAGRRAKANHDGAFVWADSNDFDFPSGGANHFDVRATGGISLVTGIDGSGNATSGVYITSGNINMPNGSISFGAATHQMLNLWNQVYGIGVQNFTEYFRSDGGFAWFRQGTHSDTTNDPGGGTRLMRLDSSGNLFVLGTVTGGGADLAERIVASDSPQPGDVVEIDPAHAGQFRLARTANSTAVAGVVSTQPGVRMNVVDEGTDDAGVQLALAGRVPVKVSAENGAIQPGDLLVASATPGHAMRAPTSPAPGTIIGKALGTHDDGTGLIEMLVMLR